MGFLSDIFGVILKWCYNLINNYGVAIILFTIISKLIILPFQMKSKKSMMEMNRLQPKLKELEQTYKNDKEKYSLLSSFGDELETVFIVSGVTVNEGEDEIKVSPADGCKCVRCWKFSENGKDTEGGFLCVRCSDILGV